MIVPVPRNEEERFRLYKLEPDGLVILATGPDMESIGCALGTMFEEDQWTGDDRIGILDTRASEEGSGVWVVNPYA